MCNLFYHPDERLEPVSIDQPLTAEDCPSLAASKLFILLGIARDTSRCCGVRDECCSRGDVCMNLMGLADPVGFENLKEGRASQRKLASVEKCRFCSLIPDLDVKLSTTFLAGSTVLSAVGACPPHDGVRRRWWINVCKRSCKRSLSD